jgi:RimJ/RimL family protein N-acetyltransferase
MQPETNFLGQPVGVSIPDWKPPARPSREAMEGRFCRVAPLDPELHAAALHEANKADVGGRMWTYLPYGPFDTMDNYKAWAGQVCQGNDPMFYAILDRASGRAVGLASYLRINPDSGSIEVGHIQYSPALQRTPAATEAMHLMMKRVFGLGYRRYEWKCDALNAPSRDAAQRLGFSFEGVFRQATLVKGRNRDTAWYSILDTEWPALNQAFLRWLHPGNFDDCGRQRERLSVLTSEALAAVPLHLRQTSEGS